MEGLRKDAARSRARILTAARMLRERGEGTPLNAVAHAADVGVGTVYRHFTTVEELEEALVLDRFHELAGLARDAAEAPEPGSFAKFLREAFGILLADDLFAEVATRAHLTLDDVARARTALIETIMHVHDIAVESGQITSRLTAADTLALLCGLAYAVRRTDADRERANAMLDVVVGGFTRAGLAQSTARPR